MKNYLTLIVIVAATACAAHGQQQKDVTIPYVNESSALDVAALPAGRFEFQATVEPVRFARRGELALVFAAPNGEGFRAVVRPHAGGVMLDRLGESEAKPTTMDRRNPTMNLAEGDYTFRLPFRVKILSGDGKVQLYLGFYGLEADFLHGEIEYSGTPPTRLEIRANQAESRCSQMVLTPRGDALPNSMARAPLRGPMPSWAKFVGTHYFARSPFRLYRGLFYEPIIYRSIASEGERPAANLRPWMAFVNAAEIPGGAVEREGPYSGKKIWVDVERARRMLEWADANDAVLLHGRDILKRTEYAGPEEIALRKDELYWSVRILYEIDPDKAAARIKFQLGNEVNGFHVPWKNHPDLIRRYVEYDFAPSAEAIRRASQDLFGSPERIPFLMASVSSPWPLASGWLVAMANTRIEGDWAPTLKGKTVMSLSSGTSIHYALKGPFWSHALDAVYNRLVRPTKDFEFWSTEEVGGNADINRGPYVAAIPFRYLDWWSRRDWQPGRGGVIYWGDTRGGKHYTTAMDVQELTGTFFADRPLRNETDAVQLRASADAEVYAFTTVGPQASRVGIAVMSRDYWFYPEVASSGQLKLEHAVLKVPEFRGETVALAWYRVTDEVITLVERRTVEAGPSGEIRLPANVTLDRAQEEILLGFAALANEAGEIFAFNYEPPTKEATRVTGIQEIEAFHMGNDLTVDLGGEMTWIMASDGGRVGRKLAESDNNIDAGMAGDHHGLTVDRRVRQELTFAVVLQRGIQNRAGELRFELRGDPVEVSWDGKLLGEVSPSNPVLPVKDVSMFSPGRHMLHLRNKNLQSTSIDSLSFIDPRKP